jgi:aspartyl-tRNA(Asn)/glutamyl-tRNA(Gln) amidotransferase subunit A
VQHGKEDYVAQLAQPISSLRIGTPASYYDGLDPEVESAVASAVSELGKMTAGVKDAALPSVSHLANVGGLGETFAYHEPFFTRSAGRYMLPERRRLQAVMDNPPKATDYIRAKWDLEMLRRKVDDAFADFDLVVMPTQKILPPLLDELIARAHSTEPSNPRIVSNCSPFNVMGLPAISIPCGFSKSGLPIGLMIAGPMFSEGKVLAVAQAYEKATQWHLRKPPLAPNTPVPPVISM